VGEGVGVGVAVEAEFAVGEMHPAEDHSILLSLSLCHARGLLRVARDRL
jgi:hypothetical protein